MLPRQARQESPLLAWYQTARKAALIDGVTTVCVGSVAGAQEFLLARVLRPVREDASAAKCARFDTLVTEVTAHVVAWLAEKEGGVRAAVELSPDRTRARARCMGAHRVHLGHLALELGPNVHDASPARGLRARL